MRVYAKCKIDKQHRITYKAFIKPKTDFIFYFDSEDPDKLLMTRYVPSFRLPYAIKCHSDEKGRITLPKRLRPEDAKEVWFSFLNKTIAILEFH